MNRIAPSPSTIRRLFAPTALCALWACSSSDTPTTPTGPAFKSSPCSQTGTLQLAVAAMARVDCSNGGTTVTLAGNGASYIVIAQFAVDLVPDTLVTYRVTSGTAVSASLSPAPSRFPSTRISGARSPVGLTPLRASQKAPGAAQRRFSSALHARARTRLASRAWPVSGSLGSRAARSVTRSADAAPLPTLGSIRSFRVLASNGNSFASAGARLAFVGANVLVYVDTLAPANGFTSTQLQTFRHLLRPDALSDRHDRVRCAERCGSERARDHVDDAGRERARLRVVLPDPRLRRRLLRRRGPRRRRGRSELEPGGNLLFDGSRPHGRRELLAQRRRSGLRGSGHVPPRAATPHLILAARRRAPFESRVRLARRGAQHRRRGTGLAVLRAEMSGDGVPQRPDATLSRFLAGLRREFLVRLVSVRTPARHRERDAPQRRRRRVFLARRRLAARAVARRPDGDGHLQEARSEHAHRGRQHRIGAAASRSRTCSPTSRSRCTRTVFPDSGARRPPPPTDSRLATSGRCGIVSSSPRAAHRTFRSPRRSPCFR